MNNNWNNLDLLQLQQLYALQSHDLEHRLLHGCSWQDVQALRLEVTALAVVIYKRLNPRSFPPDPASHKIGKKLISLT